MIYYVTLAWRGSPDAFLDSKQEFLHQPVAFICYFPAFPHSKIAHIIQFPFTFQFRFGLLCFASSRSSTKNSLTFNFIVVSLMFSRFAVYLWINWPAARVSVCFVHKRMSRMYFNFAFCYMLACPRWEFSRNRNIWRRRNRREWCLKTRNYFWKSHSGSWLAFLELLIASRLVEPVSEAFEDENSHCCLSSVIVCHKH